MSTYDVFLSHASADKPVVEELARRLREDGLDPFLDIWHLVPGEPWQEALEDALEASRSCAVFVGAKLGPWQNEEMRAALDERVRQEDFRVIPVLLPGASRPRERELPRFLRRLTWVEFRSGLDGEAYHRLVCGIRGVAPEAGKRPEPRYPSDETRDLSRALKAAYRRRAELEARGEDTTQLTETVLDLRRKIREGGQLKAGDLLLDGRFELLEPIGRGGFAQVWRAYDEKSHAEVAVKVLHVQYAEDKTRRERFFRGARQMARLQHPRIVRVIEEHCEEGGYHFFVMEYVGGGDLRQAVKASRLSPEQRLQVIWEVGEALSFAHARGMIHRDVKPGNVLLDPAGRAKLTDFDLVLAADTTGGTRTTALGTFLYAAPEAMMDAREAAEPADVYGLGMTAIFALHGADLPPDVIWELPAFIKDLKVTGGCRNALQRAVARKSEDRWATVAEFCQALRGRRRRWTDPVLGIEFVYVEPGEFRMGSPEDEEDRFDQEERHRVKLTRGFWMATTEVTQSQFAKFVEATGYETETEKAGGSRWRESSGPDHPVVYVSWNDAERFCEWLSGQVEGEIRLPTEAEWEYAARAGTETASYSPKLDDIAWYLGNSDGHAHPLRTKEPNDWGLYDMLGNVWEWVADWYGDYPDDTEGVTPDPAGPRRGAGRVIRGGSWNVLARGVRAACRGWNVPGDRYDYLGFRLARGQGRGAAEPQ